MALPDLLAECARLLNAFGPESFQVDEFIKEHSTDDPEFAELAELSRRLKRAFLAGQERKEEEFIEPALEHHGVNRK
jgi:hypothetical protein